MDGGLFAPPPCAHRATSPLGPPRAPPPPDALCFCPEGGVGRASEARRRHPVPTARPPSRTPARQTGAVASGSAVSSLGPTLPRPACERRGVGEESDGRVAPPTAFIMSHPRSVAGPAALHVHMLPSTTADHRAHHARRARLPCRPLQATAGRGDAHAPGAAIDTAADAAGRRRRAATLPPPPPPPHPPHALSSPTLRAGATTAGMPEGAGRPPPPLPSLPGG